MNVGARIASATGPGELLASLELCWMASVGTDAFEPRELRLQGKQDPLAVAVIPPL